MGIDLQAYRQESRETWDAVAPGWEHRREWMMEMTGPVNDWLLDHADPQSGQTVLEIAAGTGDLGFRAAERVQPEGRVICTDFAPEMLDVARRNGESRGLSNVEYRRLDAEHMDLEDDSADVALCRWGYMLMADPLAALRETRRVLRAGGVLAFTVWRGPDRNPWAAVPGTTLLQLGHMQPPDPNAPGMFSMADADKLKGLVTRAGFAEPQLEEITFSFRYRDDEDLWDTLMGLGGALARLVSSLPDDEQHATREAIFRNLAPLRTTDGSYVAPAATWGVLAR
jgi:ubiquinone/menaquinone biosynthesis C-methylase UbiE